MVGKEGSKMKTNTIATRGRFGFAIVAAFMALCFVLTFGNVQASAATKTATKSAATTKTTTPKVVTYDYVAQSGDSYTLMARKSVQTYAKKNKINLSSAQIVYAETNLTQQAGSLELNLGQTVKIDQATVKAWVDKAAKLSAADQAAWVPYTTNANFDTSAVGVAS